MSRTLLYVDDELENHVVFRATFADEFEVLEATSGEEALATLAEREVPVVIADQRMPGMSGTELCEIIKVRHPHTIRMILTGYSDPEAMMDAINKGHVYSFITKPWEREALFCELLRGFEAYELAMTNNALSERLAHAERCATLGRLAAGIAHEMGNQLLIAPLFELIEERYKDKEDLLDLAGIAKETSDRLGRLIEEVKSFVRMEQKPSAMKDVLLDHLLHETLSFGKFDKKIPADCISLRICAEPVVSVNRTKMQQALLNLLKNAADAVSSRADPAIVISVEAQDDEAIVTVQDNGCGIDEETLGRIWDPFFSTKETGGTGLGLDITRQIIEAHQGSITCASTPGVGTTFSVRLPIVCEKSTAAHRLADDRQESALPLADARA